MTQEQLADRRQAPDGQVDQGQELARAAYATYSTQCPSCGVSGRLTVIQVEPVRGGETFDVDVALSADGFIIPAFVLRAEKEMNIETGRVRCGGCQVTVALEDLLLS